MHVSRPRSWTLEQLYQAVRENTTWKATAKAVGADRGLLHRVADEVGIDYSHFPGVGRGVRLQKFADDEIFVVDSPASIPYIRERFKELVKYECKLCGLSEWNGMPLPLQMDHVNGNNRDNRIENLRLLCANCHSQTETWGPRNHKRSR